MHYLSRIGAPVALLLASCPGLIASDSDSGSGSTSGSAATTTTPIPTTGFMLVCLPGQQRCEGEVLETCKPSGDGWDQDLCADSCAEDIVTGSAACIGPCELLVEPTSLGCEFIAIRMASGNFGPEGQSDALIVGNTDPDRLAAIQLHFTPDNSVTEAPLQDPVVLAPGESHIFDLAEAPLAFSNLRTGGVYRLVSDYPVAAYLHSPLANKASNDASMLLPSAALRKDYVVASYPAFADLGQPDLINGRPSYFTVIALANDTTVQWTPPRATAAQGLQIPGVAPGETGTKVLQRFDVLQIAAASPAGDTDFFHHDVSGTVVSADKPIWVMGATQCAFVPFGSGWCNHLQELMIPLEYWGSTYLAPPAPQRADERLYWRVYAGADDVTVVTEDNDHLNLPTEFLEQRGDFFDIDVEPGTSLLFTGLNDAPILAVQYLAGNLAASGIGDPAMVQMIPVEQWRDRYVFVTGAGYEANYAQVIRRTGAADVTINGALVGGYQLANFGPDHNYQVADVPLPGGAEALTYIAESSDEFSVVVIGYNPAGPAGTDTSAYAYPGGMRLRKIYVP